MMRRLVDTAIPLCCLIGLTSLVGRAIGLPQSLEHTLGAQLGLVWAGVLSLCYLVDLIGIWLRATAPTLPVDTETASRIARRNRWSYRLEVPSLIVGGLISTIYATAIFSFAGLSGWTAAWWIYGIGVYLIARFAELTWARRKVAAQGDR